ncbi:hypothetical protein GALMADRAFT_156774 [Galerina marginata CBS 339.88]|uniref:Uncharacterized protein n=1 Tax=Galerina marginata (strain CBS 339.88) TaxID=685588 RepID=A0A067SY07_GALM3|nr:hypothetical protein GALMADRAFT_156774 [Galerina marginata CBS 339.88]
MFNRLLLIACVCIVVALILYFFYWNRFIAFIIGQTIRLLFWNQEGSSIWIEIGSIHFSLLTGRILLKDVHYHSSNQTIKIVKGQIQWRYWIRRPTSEEEIHSIRGEQVKHASRLWSCRIQLSFQGVEWFLYNRTAAYDNIIEQIEKSSRPMSRSSSHGRFFSRFSHQDAGSPFYPPSVVRASMRVPDPVKRAMAWFRHQLPTLDPKDLLPLGIDIQTGAIILGNHSTPNILVAEFQNALGTFGVVPARSRYDLYKQVLNLKFQNALIRLVHNGDYIDSMTTLGALVHNRIKHHPTLRKPTFYQNYRTFFKLWRQIKLYGLVTDYFATRRTQHINQTAGAATAKKSKKTIDEDTPVGIDFSTFEYAVERKMLETPTLDLTYYVDVVGEVPSQPITRCQDGVHDIGNGDTAPEWGIDLVMYGGFLRYGPWADRQRAELQRAFFPPTYLDSEVTPNLRPGEKRSWTALQVFVELRDETTLHIPFREASKDWQWDGSVNIPQRPRVREPAYVSLAIGDRSSINYIMPMAVGPSGYESTLEIHLDTISITSSLNDIRLISAESFRVRGELPSPIRWEAERTWTISAFLRQPVLFLLRDHINMITDLGKDWVSGPPTEYQKFVPTIYVFKLEMHHFEMNLYANDQNIVDKPLIKEENALITVVGPHLKSFTTIPSNTFRPNSTLIPFHITAPDLAVNISLPRWNTHALHARKEGINLLKSSAFNLSGSYRYFAEVKEEYVEQLRLQFDLKDSVFRAYGWSIRYFMVLRDNYFGSFTHFQTLYEYLDKRRRNAPVGDPIGLKYRPGKANMLQVEISLRVEAVRTLLPIGLVGGSAQHATGATMAAHEEDGCLALRTSEIQLQFRMHDYYMEMSLNLDTITGAIKRGRAILPSSSGCDQASKEILTIDGVYITANRLFGPQPRTATYVCIWEIAVGNVKASMLPSEIMMLAAAGNSFRLNFVDLVNAPAPDFLPVDDPDVSFYKITVKTIEMNCKAGNAVLLVQMQHGLKLDSNDLGAHQYRKVTSLKVPHISTKVLLTSSVERNAWLEAAEAVFDVYLDIYASPVGHRAMTRTQLAFIEEQDRLTGRAKRMFNQLRPRAKVNNASIHNFHRNGIYLPQPTLPNLANSSPTSISPQRANIHHRTPSWRFSAFTNLSDSEGEEGVSEADRDARLARTRTSTPVPEHREDEVTTSSGDESDDADLTDSNSVGDDWSDVGDSSNEQATSSLLLFYSPIVRHYVPNWLGTPEFWEGVSFTKTREGAPFMHLDTETEGNGAPNATSFTSLDDIPRDENITTFRLKLCKTTSVVITPLLLPAAVYFEEEIKNVLIGPELCVDSLMVDCLARIFAKETSKSVVFQLVLPNAKIQLTQHMTMSEEGSPNIAKAMQSTALPSNLDVTAVLNLGLHGLYLSGVVGQSSSFVASLEKATGMLDRSIDKRTLAILSDNYVVELVLSSPSIKLAQHTVGTNLGVISIKIGNRGPELVAATVIALLSMGALILELVDGLKSHQRRTKRTIIGNILKATEQQGPVIDSLSTTQPSYLVQTGAPHILRTDATFKFLYHLRNNIHVGDPENPLLRRSSSLIGLPDLVSLIEARLALLDQDAYSVGHLKSMDPHLFDQEERTDTNRLKQQIRHIDFLSTRLTTATITVLDPSGGLSSQFAVDNLGLILQSRTSDLIQFNLNNLSTASQTSLRSKTPKIIRGSVVTISLGNATLVVSPNLMNFAQNILRVKRSFSSGLTDTTPTKVLRELTDKSSIFSSRLWSLDIIAVIQHLRVQAAAENLILVMGFNGIQASSALLAAHYGIQSMSHAILFDEVYFQARSPANPAKESDQDILAAVAFITGRVSGVSRPETGSRKNLKLVFTLASLRLHVPRSALRLYRFIGEWRADYLPGIEAAMKTLLSEYKARPTKPHSPAPSRLSGRGLMLQIHGQVGHFEISLQVMHGTWLSWEFNKTVAYFQSSAMMTGGTHAFGLQVASMVVSISSKPNAREVAPSSRVKLALPPLSLAGNSDGYRIHTLVLFEFVELKVKPSHWDTLLSVQQKFGQDFNDLVTLIQKTRQEGSLTSTKPIGSKGTVFQYEAHLKMRGFRIGLEGVSSTVLLECQDINGGVSNAKDWVWDVSLSDLALSLAPRVGGHRNTTFNRDHRSAFVIIDFRFDGSNSNANDVKTLQLSVSKIHAVMQASSIGEFGDFIDNLQAELLERQEQRALELAAFKEKTRRILETFDVNVGDVQLEETSWINELTVNISIRSIGVAFPLTHDDELVLPQVKGQELPPVPAFLFSIKSIEFATNRGETGQAIMQRLSFQFISRFRQSAPEDFAAERHHTRNCLLYPHMMAQLRSSSSSSSSDRSRKISIKADVSGFILDIDSTIPKYIFSLIDVYRQGKERVERLSANAPLTPFSSIPIAEDLKPPPVEKRYTSVPTSNVFINLVFHSGKVRLYSGAASKLFKASSSRFLELSDEQILSLGAEVFNLPVVSVWGEYRATPASQKLPKGPEQEPSILMFNSTVHSSNNVLRPTLLPFLTELVNRIESRMRKVSYRTSRRSSAILPVPSMSSISRIDDGDLEDYISSMQICFSLRIDQSKLELTCQPDVNVVAGLHWENGGFVVNVSPGAKEVSFFGSVGGLTVGLKHGFLSEDCVKLDARNLAFSVSFRKMELGSGNAVNSISVALDTEFLGAVRFSRLQDILCFKAVWLDRIPIFNKQSPIETQTPFTSTFASTMDTSPKVETPSDRGLSTIILVRIRNINLEVDLGQSITRINLGLHNSIFRTKLADELNEVFLFVDEVSLTAQGNISGHAHVSSCVFQTIRRSEDAVWNDNTRSKMLELKLTSNALVVSLDSDHQQLLHYRAEPLEVEISDDWSKIQTLTEDDSRPLQLSFTVTCPEIVAAATVGTIPKLLSYMNKFKANLDAQRQGAFRESQTFRATRTPKPDNPLSAVAEAMLHSARSRFKEADSGLSYTIRQHMSLRLDLLRLIVFPRSMRDLEIAQFIGRDVQARLDGAVGSDSMPARRDLHLSFSSMIISKYTQIGHPPFVSVNSIEEQAGPDWLTALFRNATEATIVGLPSMKMHMISEESSEEFTTTLTYDFHSEFIRRAGMKAFEDIYITLNMSLYSWLTVLRKNLTREMEQVRAAEDWRNSMSTVSTTIVTGGTQRKKKIPEPLSLTDSPRSATLPTAGSTGLSPFAPSSARYGWMDPTRAPQSSREQSLSPLAQTLSPFPSMKEAPEEPATLQGPPKRPTMIYKVRNRHIERLTMRQLGEATPDVMHPFFMKKAGFNLEDSLPQYVHEYATNPLEEIMEVLLKLYSQQLLKGTKKTGNVDPIT